MSNFKYINSRYVQALQDLFLSTFLYDDLNSGVIGRERLYDFSKSNEFIKLYYLLAEEIVKKLDLNTNEVNLQPNVTLREFNSNSHGTSFHTDYLYGHGVHTNTIWVPLYGLRKGNSFWILDGQNDCNPETLALNYTKKLENELLQNSFEFLPAKNQCLAFSSNTIHGSPLNKTKITRYSFDFRIALANDKTSTKKSDEYLILQDNKWISKTNPFDGYSFLKYICGGLEQDTSIQHEVIEYVAKKNNFAIVGQEAEIERFGFKVMERYLKDNGVNKGFNAIIIASKNVINDDCINLIKKSKLKVYSALEGIFLN